MHRTEPEVLSGACLLLSNVLLGCLKLMRSGCAWFTRGQAREVSECSSSMRKLGVQAMWWHERTLHRAEREVLSGACVLLSNVLLGCLKLLRSGCAWFTRVQAREVSECSLSMHKLGI